MATASVSGPPDVVGHGWVLDLVQRGLEQGRLPHSLLLCGPAHVGKFTTALAIARLLLCPQTPPCGICRHCSLALRRVHPDLQILELPPDRRTIPLRDVHELMHGMALRPLEAARKVYIIRGAEDLAEEGANALLKTLEEPPPAVTLILTAPDPATLLPTIVSRCQLLGLRPAPSRAIADHLVGLGVDPARADRIAAVSGGRPGWAIMAANDETLANSRSERAQELVGLLSASRLDRMRAADALAERWRDHPDEVREALHAWSEVWHELLLASSGLPEALAYSDLTGELRSVAERVSATEVQRALAATLDVADALEWNAHPRLALEAYLLFLPRLAGQTHA